MNYLKYIYETKNIKLIIEEDIVGFYIIVYNDPSSMQSNADYLQDTFDDAFSFSERKFGVKKDQWKLLSD